VKPLIGGSTQVVCGPDLFLRRSLTRYLALAVCRLLEKSKEDGATGKSASVEGFLLLARKESAVSQGLLDRIEKAWGSVRSTASRDGYDLISALFFLRNTQLAHSLIPHSTEDEVWAHDLLGFSQSIFGFVVNHETAVASELGVTFSDLPAAAKAFERECEQFWK